MSPAPPMEARSRYERAAMDFFRAWAELPATFRQEMSRWMAEAPLREEQDAELVVALAAMLNNLNDEVDT